MRKGWREAGLIGPALVSIAALAVLLGLGTWQLSRKAWKEDLIARIAARTTAPPISLAEALRRWRAGEDLEYARVQARGTFVHAREQHLYAPSPGGLGWHVYTPLEIPALGEAILFVNRGLVPDAQRDPRLRAGQEGTGEAEVTGLVRAPERQGWFTPANDPARNQWFWRDLAGMMRAAYPAATRDPVPFFVDAEAAPQPAGEPAIPRGGVTRITLPNRHLEYALTWYGLAAALVAVFLVFAQRRLEA